MPRNGRWLNLLAVSALLLSVAAGSACADTVNYLITAGNSAISPFTGPYATVTVNRTDSTHATVSFDSLSGSGYIFLMGGANSAAVNVNATAWTVSSISASNSVVGGGFTAQPTGYPQNDGSNNVSDFGTFNQTIKNFDGFGQSSTHVQFTLTDDSGSWATAGNVLAPNGGGNIIAAHMFVCALAPTCKQSNGAVTTGFASVPIPAAAWLFGSGLVALIGIIRRSSLRKSPALP